MSKSTISTFQLFALIPDAETARAYLEARLWPQGPRCPVCRSCERITARSRGFYRCNACKEDFTVRTGTIFERSHVPLHKWDYAMYLLVTARKGISSLQLAKEIGITQKSAWFVLGRLREACGGKNLTKLKGIVAIDETYFGGLEANKHEHKKLKAGRGPVGKTPVLAMREQGGNMVALKVREVNTTTVQSAIFANIELGSTLHTDEAPVYAGLDGLFFDHDTVNHSAGEYVRDGISTNNIESVFAVMKLCQDCPPVGYPTDKTRCLPCPRRTPKALDDVADIVLAYKPKPKAEAAKKRQRKARKIERDKAK